MFNFSDKLDKVKANNLSPVVLAFVGDAVYSLFVRERLVFTSDCKTGELNKRATAEVKATAQAEFIREIMPLLTDEELSVFKRARNSKKKTKAKSASVTDYNASTGMEAVIGYLYITGDMDRLNYILNRGKEQ